MTIIERLAERGIRIWSIKPHQYVLCPECSDDRRSKAKRRKPVLGVLIDEEWVSWGCNHCDFKGGFRIDGTNSSTRRQNARPETGPSAMRKAWHSQQGGGTGHRLSFGRKRS